jgi:hypothetical protein
MCLAKLQASGLDQGSGEHSRDPFLSPPSLQKEGLAFARHPRVGAGSGNVYLYPHHPHLHQHSGHRAACAAWRCASQIFRAERGSFGTTARGRDHRVARTTDALSIAVIGILRALPLVRHGRQTHAAALGNRRQQSTRYPNGLRHRGICLGKSLQFPARGCRG